MERLKKNRKVYVGAAFVAILLALGVGQMMLDRRRRRRPSRRRSSRSIRSGRSRCRTTGCSGRPSASASTTDDHVWIIHRGNDPGTARSRSAPSWPSSTTDGAPAASASAAIRRRRCSNSIRPATRRQLGRPVKDCTLRLARDATTASSSITRASCGSAATAAPTRTS